MKIAVPSRDGCVDPHFGNCAEFIVFELNESKKVIGKDVYTPPSGCGCKTNAVAQLAHKGVTLALVGNIGQGAVNVLQGHGINVIKGCSGGVDQLLEDFAADRLSDSDSICSAHHDCV